MIDGDTTSANDNKRASLIDAKRELKVGRREDSNAEDAKVDSAVEASQADISSEGVHADPAVEEEHYPSKKTQVIVGLILGAIIVIIVALGMLFIANNVAPSI